MARAPGLFAVGRQGESFESGVQLLVGVGCFDDTVKFVAYFLLESVFERMPDYEYQLAESGANRVID